jgi:uncharacterized hydrophobic protein (TIGR00271 family)
MANGVISTLRSFDVEHRGSITVERIDMSLSDVAMHAEAAAPGDPGDAVIWEEVEARLRSEATLSAGLIVLMSAAVMIAAIGILTDSVVLIVGAMVIGPEYGAISAMALGLHKRHAGRFRRAATALAVAFSVAIVAAWSMALAIEAAGRTPPAYELGERPLTSFISHPDVFSIIIAALAAIAGTVSLTQSRHGALVGVLVSVTTIPAAANIGVALAHGRADEATGALVQLVANVATIVAVSTLTLLAEHRFLRRLHRRPHGGAVSIDPLGPSV